MDWAKKQVKAYVHIELELGVIPSREWRSPCDTYRARRPAQGSLGNDVYSVRFKFINHFSNSATRKERETNLRIYRQRHGFKLTWFYDRNFIISFLEPVNMCVQYARNAVNLRRPRISNQ